MLYLTLFLPLAAPAQSSRLAEIKPAPLFSLVDQNGERLELGKQRGSVLLVGFIFTTCNGSCPATTHRMAQVQDELRRRGFLKEKQVKLLSITLDPERDTPEVLRRYAQLFDLDTSSWSFLTGPAGAVHAAIRDWGMWVRPSANAQLDHPSRVFLVDGAGVIREIYNLAFLKAGWVADDAELLLKERQRFR